MCSIYVKPGKASESFSVYVKSKRFTDVDSAPLMPICLIPSKVKIDESVMLTVFDGHRDMGYLWYCRSESWC